MADDATNAIADAVIEDTAFLDEEVRIAHAEIAAIKVQLKTPNLSAEAFNALHAKLRAVYQRFLTANDMVKENAKQLKQSVHI